MRRGLRSARFAPLCAVLLTGCMTSQSDYDELKARYEQQQAANHQLSAENQALQERLAQQAQSPPQAQPQQRTYTLAADMLFAAPRFDLTPAGQAALNDIAARLRGIRNGKIVVYGYTDDQKVGGSLIKEGITTNIDLSSRRADVVVNYLRSHGVDPNILSAKGRGETHPVAANTTPAGRAKNRRVEIVVEGPGN